MSIKPTLPAGVAISMLALSLAACVTPPEALPALGTPEAAGFVIASTHCARCHAIGANGRSQHSEAIPFRHLTDLYPLEGLEESLVEGLMTGHSDMPEFKLSATSANDLIAYLASIQAPGDPANPR